ncbi:MAG: 3-oxoacyl-[acyl-carrier protein] reductase [Parvibaculaceae bacterium]|jgi:3-oxoacyl-[acyl-carrier protein] reductase|tara:strand:+ start:415 stop:1194 length:780 start_codon:yes stop_codon:yes gene_type:complete
MDLGLADKTALVCASSQGLGKACALSLAKEGCAVVINGRSLDNLAQAQAEIEQATGKSVVSVQADLNLPEGRDKLLAACGPVDILVTNNEGPPPGAFLQWTQKDWQQALDANLLAPTFLIQAVLPGMQERKFGRIVNITSAMVKSPKGVMGLSTAARSGLTALCKGLSQDVAADNVTINNMLPERFDTNRQKQMAELAMAFKKITYEEAREEIAQTIAAKRLGQPSEFGDACAFLCSAQAGFISGQNLQLDGGSYAGLI